MRKDESFVKDGRVFYKKHKRDKIWWLYWENPDDIKIGFHEFSFDGQKIFNLFADYPHNLTAEQKRTIDKENPFWADFFSDRNQNQGGMG